MRPAAVAVVPTTVAVVSAVIAVLSAVVVVAAVLLVEKLLEQLLEVRVVMTGASDLLGRGNVHHRWQQLFGKVGEAVGSAAGIGRRAGQRGRGQRRQAERKSHDQGCCGDAGQKAMDHERTPCKAVAA